MPEPLSGQVAGIYMGEGDKDGTPIEMIRQNVDTKSQKGREKITPVGLPGT